MPRNQSSTFALLYALKHIGEVGTIERLERACLVFNKLNIKMPEHFVEFVFLSGNRKCLSLLTLAGLSHIGEVFDFACIFIHKNSKGAAVSQSLPRCLLWAI